MSKILRLDSEQKNSPNKAKIEETLKKSGETSEPPMHLESHSYVSVGACSSSNKTLFKAG